MHVRALVAGVLVAAAGACTSPPQAPPAGSEPAATATPALPSPTASPTAAAGRAGDLAAVMDAYESTHPEPPSDLATRIADLAAEADELSRDQFLVEVMRLSAGRDRDGHTGVFPLAQEDLRIWPLQLYDFDDGWRVLRAQDPYRDLVGGRVTHIGGRPIDEIADLAAPLVSRDNASTVRGRLPQYLVVPSVLRGLGIEPSLTVDGNTVSPKAISSEDYAAWNDIFYPLVCPRLRSPSAPDWDVGVESGAVVARYGLVSSLSGDQNIHEFAERIGRLARKADGAVVIDLRDNPGGENGTYGPLLRTLQLIDKRDPGRLRLLMNRCTFSAATNFVAEVLSSTAAISVGEPMGGAPNMWGDADEFTLPESQVVLHMATVEWELGGRNKRPMIKPNVAVPVRWSDYRRGVDQALRAALTQR